MILPSLSVPPPCGGSGAGAGPSSAAPAGTDTVSTMASSFLDKQQALRSAGDTSYSALDRRTTPLGGRVNTMMLFSDNQVLAMQFTCCILAGISLVLGLVICYWMARMKKVFRHHLIFFLMLTDMLRSTWLFLFPLISLARGGISSTSAFCQVSGFFSNASYDMADWIVLFIAINTALQVFKPHPIKSGHGGLYAYRYWVYAVVIIVPLTMSALAFVNKTTVGAYLSQGPTCSLPIRPFWYRLALSWIPRYIIILVVLCLYVAIYVHAERQFVEHRPLHRRLSAAVFVYPSSRSRMWLTGQWFRPKGPKRRTVAEINASLALRGDHAPTVSSKSASDEKRADLRANADEELGRPHYGAPGSWSQAASARTSVAHAAVTRDEKSRLDSAFTDSTLVNPTQSAATTPIDPNPTQAVEIDNQLAWREMRKKHRIIRRQLRLQFVYPIIYFVTWLAPFASHITMYIESVARRPIFPLVIIGYASLALMGIVDFTVFSLRERPWRHIPGSDGTILGSFVFWKRVESRRVPLVSQHSSATDSGQRHAESSLDSSTGIDTRRSSAATPATNQPRRGTGVGIHDRAVGTQLQTIPSVGGDGDDADDGARAKAAMRGMVSWDFGMQRGPQE